MAFRIAAAFSRQHSRHLSISATSRYMGSFFPEVESKGGKIQQHLLFSTRMLPTIPLRIGTRALSSTGEASSPSSKEKDDKKKGAKKDDANVFLDNLGKIFLAAIATIIMVLVRSSRGTTMKNKLRDELEERSSLDPMEVDDLRVANSEMTPQVFTEIAQNMYRSFPQGTITYMEFVKSVRSTMVGLKGEAFTIELGHLVDRAIFDAIQQQQKNDLTAASHQDVQEQQLPVAFFLTALSMALNSSVQERIDVLYQVVRQDGADVFGNSNNNQSVTIANVLALVGYLQDTCQLTPDTQVIASDIKYPVQQYKRGTPGELLQWKDDAEGESSEEKEHDEIDAEAFSTILRSKSVCAWGECYSRKVHISK